MQQIRLLRSVLIFETKKNARINFSFEMSALLKSTVSNTHAPFKIAGEDLKFLLDSSVMLPSHGLFGLCILIIIITLTWALLKKGYSNSTAIQRFREKFKTVLIKPDKNLMQICLWWKRFFFHANDFRFHATTLQCQRISRQLMKERKLRPKKIYGFDLRDSKGIVIWPPATKHGCPLHANRLREAKSVRNTSTRGENCFTTLHVFTSSQKWPKLLILWLSAIWINVFTWNNL